MQRTDIKKVLSILLLSMSACLLSAQTVDYGAVKRGSKTERTYYAEDGNMTVTSFTIEDTSGNVSYISDDFNQTSYFEDSLLVRRVFVQSKSEPLAKEVATFRYENGKLCEVSGKSFLGDRQVSSRYESHTFDTVANKEYIYEYRDGKPESKTVKTYDFDHCLIKSATYIADCQKYSAEQDGKPTPVFEIKSSRSYVYDENSELIETIDYVYDSEGVAQRILTFFDKNQNILASKVFDADDFLMSETSYKYDRKGNETQRVTVNYIEDGSKETLTTKNTYKYDRQGRVTLRENYYNGIRMFTDRTVYL